MEGRREVVSANAHVQLRARRDLALVRQVLQLADSHVAVDEHDADLLRVVAVPAGARRRAQRGRAARPLLAPAHAQRAAPAPPWAHRGEHQPFVDGLCTFSSAAGKSGSSPEQYTTRNLSFLLAGSDI